MTTITEVNSKDTVDRTAVQSLKRFYLFTKHTGVLYTYRNLPGLQYFAVLVNPKQALLHRLCKYASPRFGCVQTEESTQHLDNATHAANAWSTCNRR